MWTQFWDMSSGGRHKLKWSQIFIEASCEQEAMIIFANRFKRHPYHVTCECCGSDYAVHTNESLEALTAYERNCDQEGDKFVERGRGDGYSPYQTLEEFLKNDHVLVIHAADVKPEERLGDVPHCSEW